MTPLDDLKSLDETLNRLATLYQFRSPEEPLYGALTVSQSYCLRSLYFSGPQTMSELAAQLQVQLSTMTGVIDQLEAKQLVHRAPHPTDRRSLQVRLTGRGRAAYKAAHNVYLRHLRPLLKNRSAADRARILGFLDDLMQALHGWRQHCSSRVQRNAKKNSKY